MKQAKSDINLKLWRSLARAVRGDEVDLGEFSEAEVVQATDEHGVGPLLHRQVKEGTVGGLSEKVRDHLAETARSQAALDLLLNQATRRFTELLDDNGIPCLLLKGTPVAHLFYPETWLRPRCDTDVYIREDQVPAAIELLRANGYQVGGHLDRKYTSKQFVAGISTFQEVSSSFDVHWKLSNRVIFQDTLPFGACYETRQPVAALGPKAFAPSGVDLLLHACIHRIAHGRNTERNRLLWLYDIHRLLVSMDGAEVQDFQQQALQKKIGVLCADAIAVTSVLFGTDVPASLLNTLEQNKKTEPSAPLIYASKRRWALADLMALPGLRQKLTFARELFS